MAENVELQYANITHNSPPDQAVLGNNTTTSTNTNTPSLTEEEKKERKNEDSLQLFKGLPQQQTFIDVNDVTEDNVNDVTDDLVYHTSSIDVWCFCFCVKSKKCPNIIQECLYKIKMKIDLWLKNKRHFGVCRFVTISVIVWITISIFFAFCLFNIISAVVCLLEEYKWNNRIFGEMCLINSFEYINCSHQMIGINILDTTQCIFNNNYTTVIHDCVHNHSIYTLNRTYQCWIESCDDTQIHLNHYPSFDDWFCGYFPLITGIVLFCFGQFCIINLKQFCCSNLCGKL